MRRATPFMCGMNGAGSRGSPKLHWSPLTGPVLSMHPGMAAAQDAEEDAMAQGNLLETTAHAAALSAIPFGIATLGMLVSAHLP